MAHDAAGESHDACPALYLLQQIKLENYWQGEQAKCL